MQREGPVILSQKEQTRLRVITEVEAGRWSAEEAAGVLGLSQRQVRRLRKRFGEEGARALMHGNRGQPSRRRLSEELRARVVALGQGRYAACNDSHFQEILLRDEGILLSRASIQRLRRQAGQQPKQRRRLPQHRSHRDRRPQEGVLLQVDGSLHHWFGLDQPQTALLGAIDDATGKVVASLFREHEDAQGYFLLLRQVLRQDGIPLELYHDRHAIFQDNSARPWTLEEQLKGQKQPTQFGRALAELGIMSIAAHSPEAKGRIERLWRTFQDRLVAELALAGVKDIRAANRFLPAFLRRFNARFAVQAEEPGLAYRPPDPGFDLDRVLSFRYQRVVARDNTVSLEGILIQIPPGPRRRSYFAARVWVHEFLDGGLGVCYQDEWLLRGKGKEVAAVRARKAKPKLPERAPTASLPLALEPPSPPVASSPRDPQAHPWRTWKPDYLKPRPRTESLSS
jgi:transposase